MNKVTARIYHVFKVAEFSVRRKYFSYETILAQRPARTGRACSGRRAAAAAAAVPQEVENVSVVG